MSEPWKTQTGWTEERIRQLAAYWSEGYTASQIAARLGGVTRNAVIAKVHRLGLSHRTHVRLRRPTPTSVAKLQDVRRNTRNRLRKLRIVSAPMGLAVAMAATERSLPPPRADDVARVSFNDLAPHHCRYIPGEARGHPLDVPMYCGLAAQPGSPYCPDHHARCNTPATRTATSRPSYVTPADDRSGRFKRGAPAVV